MQSQHFPGVRFLEQVEGIEPFALYNVELIKKASVEYYSIGRKILFIQAPAVTQLNIIYWGVRNYELENARL